MSKTASDHALAVIKSSISAVPCIGGSIASLIGDYIPTATQRSINQAIDYLKDQLEQLKDRIDPEAVNKDEFSELFKTCYLTIVRTHQEQKLKAASRLIVNILLKEGDPEKISYAELDHFARCVEILSIGAIEALSHTIRVAQREREAFGHKNVRLDFASVHRQIPEMQPDLLMGLLEELNSFHLVHLAGEPAVRTPKYGNYPIELPPLGARFATKFLLLDSDGAKKG